MRYFRPPLGVKSPAVRRYMKVEGKNLEYAHVSFFHNDTKVSDAESGKVLMDKIKSELLEKQGGALVLHEMRFKANSDQSQYTKDWLPAALDELIIWAKAEGFAFSTYP